MNRSHPLGAARWLSFGVVLAIGWFYVWTAVPRWEPGALADGGQAVYNLLTRGFLRGHLYLDARPDPALAALANPWDPAQRGERGFPDASYYHGRYYLYYGVSPAVLLFLPFRLLTGRFLGEAPACLLFALTGFILSAWLLLAVRARHFPQVSGAWAVAGIIALGLADMMPDLLRRPGFREIPITCGYACCMLGLSALFQALHSRRPGAWLAGAGAAFALAVGSRPLYLLACPAVLLPVWWDARERGLGRGCWRDRAWRHRAAAAIAPMAAIGLGLAIYNFERFGSPFEFGLRYQFWTEDPAKTTRFAWRFAAYNLHAYWLAPAGWGRFFPFVQVASLPAAPRGFYGAEDPYGILPNMPFVFLAFGLTLAAPGASAGRRRVFCAAVAGIALVMGAAMTFFQAALNRYMVDFLPTLVLSAGLGLFVLAAQPWWRGPARALAAGAVALLVGWSALFNVLASIRHDELLRLDDPELYRPLAHRWNWIPYLCDRWRNTPYGPVEITLVFPAGRIGAIEPLVVTGHSFLSDYLFVQYLGPEALRFGLEHTSRGTFWGPAVRFQPGRPHTLRVDLGSLYPPAAHPYFDRMNPVEAKLRQDTVRVMMDGTVAFYLVLPTYEAAGAVPLVGAVGGRGPLGEPFSGTLLSWRRLVAAPAASGWSCGSRRSPGCETNRSSNPAMPGAPTSSIFATRTRAMSPSATSTGDGASSPARSCGWIPPRLKRWRSTIRRFAPPRRLEPDRWKRGRVASRSG